MVRTCCDVCGADVGNDSENFYGGREYKIITRHTCDDDWEDGRTLTLCTDCNAVLLYIMRNSKAFEKPMTQMRLSNRIRFLFKRQLKEETKSKW